MPTDPGAASSNAAPAGAAFEIWPHRSLSCRGVTTVVGMAALGVAATIAMQAGPARLPLALGGALAVASLALAFWSNIRSARCRESIEIGPHVIRVTKVPVRGMPRTLEFDTYWVQLNVRQDRAIANRIVLRERGRSCSIGEFLSPDERKRLAAELIDTIAAVRRGIAPA